MDAIRRIVWPVAGGRFDAPQAEKVVWKKIAPILS